MLKLLMIAVGGALGSLLRYCVQGWAQRSTGDWAERLADGTIELNAGRATLELFDEAQAATVDQIEAGHRVSGTVRFALEVVDSESTAERLVAAGAERVAAPVTPPWGGRNARVRAPDGMQLTLFTSE